jgi:phenylalanyl-tRNA synthetase beta chain
MIISLNWLKEYTDIDLPVDELAKLIGARLVEIEEIIDLGQKYKDALIVKAVKVRKMEGSDHLNIADIDDGGATNNIERDSEGLIQVVCGAPNLEAGQMVVWLPPKSIVPQTYGISEPFVLESRKLRGFMSNGMIASGSELDLSDDHTGILVLDSNNQAGAKFAEVYSLNDTLLDIANKSLTHRPDCFGIIGFAREVAAIQGKKFSTPDWLTGETSMPMQNTNDKHDINVSIDNPELSSAYNAVVMSGIDATKKSPIEVQMYLSRVGVRPINAVVDVTNYLMMLTGQPLHAFDYDKLIALTNGKPDIHVRYGREGEKLELLDGKLAELSSEDIVIAAGDKAVALAGAMGGIDTAVDSNTKNIVLEGATFNLYKLRGTQMRHGIFSESVTRFTKGQPAELSSYVLNKAAELMARWTGATVASNVASARGDTHNNEEIEFEIQKVNEILGSSMPAEDVCSILEDVGFNVTHLNDSLVKVVSPYWRADIHIFEDIVEEIGRLTGFDNVNPTLPTRYFTSTLPDNFDIFRTDIRKILTRAGANELLTYSFVHGDMIKQAGQNPDNSYRIVNSISPDLQYYRQSLTPSLIENIHPNIKKGYNYFAVYEINKVHQKAYGMTDENVPVELDSLSLAVSSKSDQGGSPYYYAKRMFEFLSSMLGLEFEYVEMDGNENDDLYAPFEYKRSAKIIDKATKKLVGVVGEYNRAIQRGFKLPEFSAGFEVLTRELYNATKASGYAPLSRYPSSERDICFKVDAGVLYGQIIDAVNAALSVVDMNVSISPVDIYQESGADTKNITIRLNINSMHHTLDSKEVSTVVDSVVEAVTDAVGAVVI